MNVKVSGEAIFAVIVVIVGGIVVYYFVRKPKPSLTAPPATIPNSSAPSVPTGAVNGGIVPPNASTPGWVTTAQQVETIASDAAVFVPKLADALSNLFGGGGGENTGVVGPFGGTVLP